MWYISVPSGIIKIQNRCKYVKTTNLSFDKVFWIDNFYRLKKIEDLFKIHPIAYIEPVISFQCEGNIVVDVVLRTNTTFLEMIGIDLE